MAWVVYVLRTVVSYAIGRARTQPSAVAAGETKTKAGRIFVPGTRGAASSLIAIPAIQKKCEKRRKRTVLCIRTVTEPDEQMKEGSPKLPILLLR